MLIQLTDILKFKKVSKTADIDIYINEAELIDLKPLLGERLYQDLVDNVGLPKYQDLLRGTTYTDNTITYTTLGLIPVLANFSVARYVIFSGDVDTPLGWVSKDTPYSTAISTASKKSRSKSCEQTAYEYWKSVRDFLNRNTDIYPLWQQCVNRRRFNINKITKH